MYPPSGEAAAKSMKPSSEKSKNIAAAAPSASEEINNKAAQEAAQQMLQLIPPKRDEDEMSRKKEKLLFLLEVASDRRLACFGGGGGESAINPSGSMEIMQCSRDTGTVSGTSAAASCLSPKEKGQGEKGDEEQERKKRHRIDYALSVLNAGSRDDRLKMIKKGVEEAKKKRTQAAMASLRGKPPVKETQDEISEPPAPVELRQKQVLMQPKGCVVKCKGQQKQLMIKPHLLKRHHTRKRTFVEKLMDVLSNPACTHAISWLPSGDSFVVVSPKAFTADVLPKYFKTAKFESFTRKLNRWGYKRITRGLGTNGGGGAVAYGHELFKRDAPELCRKMTGGKRDHSQTDPINEEEEDYDWRPSKMIKAAEKDQHEARSYNSGTLNSASTKGMTIKNAKVFLPMTSAQGSAPQESTPIPLPTVGIASRNNVQSTPLLRAPALINDRFSRLADFSSLQTLHSVSTNSKASSSLQAAVTGAGGCFFPNPMFSATGLVASRASSTSLSCKIERLPFLSTLKLYQKAAGTTPSALQTAHRAHVPQDRALFQSKLYLRKDTALAGERKLRPLASKPDGSLSLKDLPQLDQGNPLEIQGISVATPHYDRENGTARVPASCDSAESAARAAATLERALAISRSHLPCHIPTAPFMVDAVSVLRADEERRSYLHRIRKNLMTQQVLQARVMQAQQPNTYESV